MKTFGRMFAAYVLILTLAFSGFAGDMSTPLAPPQPAPTPAQAQGEITTGLNGNIHTGAPGDIHTTEATANVMLAEAVVGLVQGVLALL
jgi:hypothetical protein